MTQEKTLYRINNFVWYLLAVVEILLLFRFFLKLLGANTAAWFTQFMYSITDGLTAPFRFVFSADSLGDSVFEWGTILAMLVYWVIAWGITKLIAMNRPVGSTEARTELRNQDNA